MEAIFIAVIDEWFKWNLRKNYTYQQLCEKNHSSVETLIKFQHLLMTWNYTMHNRQTRY